eukprot:9220198-Alexandrium_andersonii.AAC.1
MDLAIGHIPGFADSSLCRVASLIARARSPRLFDLRASAFSRGAYVSAPACRPRAQFFYASRRLS